MAGSRGLAINRQIARQFYATAEQCEVRGDRYKFRALAYRQAAVALEKLDRGVDEIYRHGWLVGLQKIEGIGNRLAHTIEAELKKRGITKK